MLSAVIASRLGRVRSGQQDRGMVIRGEVVPDDSAPRHAAGEIGAETTLEPHHPENSEDEAR